MLDDILFRIALAPSALLFWCRYIAWPLAVVAVIGLIYFRLTPHPERRRKVVVVRRILIGAGAVLATSMAVAYLLIPKSDPQVFVIWYGAAIGSIPILMPAGMAVAVILSMRPSRPQFPTIDQANSLARQATVLLQQGLRVADAHAYYCGMGLEWMNGTFVFDAVQDGEIAAPDQVTLHGQRRRQFLDPDKFCEWLAEELVKHPRGPTSEISYWRLKCQVDEFKGNLLDHQCDRHTGEFPPC